MCQVQAHTRPRHRAALCSTVVINITYMRYIKILSWIENMRRHFKSSILGWWPKRSVNPQTVLCRVDKLWCKRHKLAHTLIPTKSRVDLYTENDYCGWKSHT